jgi:malonyl-CoA/methylmalonyl-CoA synthetase
MIRDLDGRWFSDDELAERIAAQAAELEQATPSGERILLEAGRDAAYVIRYLAVLRAGRVAVPVNPEYPPPERTRIAAAARAGNDPAALLLFTSGTTGTPKGVPLTREHLDAGARAVTQSWEWSSEDTLLLALPLFHMHGLGVGLHGALAAGSRIVLRPGFAPADIAEHAGGATMFFGVPAMYERLARGGHLAALRGLRLIVSGSAPLPAALSETVLAQAGQRPLERYGMTETGMITGNPLHGDRRPGTVGRPFPGVSLRLAADGEIEVRGPAVIDRYDGGVGADAFTEDGWFRTGDVGALDPDGYLRIVGRKKELIISGGFNVFPAEVEAVLAQCPGVEEVAVVGRSSGRWGEEVTAVVVGAVDPQALRRFAAERLAPYKVPRAVEFVGELPRNALGKVLRNRL